MTEHGPLGIRLLGRLGACRGDVEVDLGGRRQRAVLAVLVLARGEVVPAERIADSLWGENLPANAVGAVQSYVSHLRRRLQPDGAPRSRDGTIVNEGTGYAVRLPADAVDAWRFERLVRDAAGASSAGNPGQAVVLLTEALELWRGPALVEYAGEPWAEAAIARLSELRATARERLLAARLDAGEAAVLVPELEALVARGATARGALAAARARPVPLPPAGGRARRAAPGPHAARRRARHRPRARAARARGRGPRPVAGARRGGPRAHAAATGRGVPWRRAPQPAAPRPARTSWTATGEIDAIRAAVADLSAGLSAAGASSRGRPGSARPGCSPRRADWRPRRAHPCSARAAASSSGVRLRRRPADVRPVLVEPGRRAQLLAGAAATARGVFDGRRTSPRTGTFAVLHGLYWLTANLRPGSPSCSPSTTCSGATPCSLRFLGLPGAPARGRAGAGGRDAADGEPREDDELLAEISLDPATVVLRPGR